MAAAIVGFTEQRRLYFASFYFRKPSSHPQEHLLSKLGHFPSQNFSIVCNFSPSFHLLLSYGSSSLYNPEIPVQMTCMKEFRASTRRRRPSFRPATSAPPQWSSRLLGAGCRTRWDNQRSGCNKHCGILNAPRRRRMSTDDNSASEFNKTRSDDEVQGVSMPISGFSFHFPYTLMFLHVYIYVEVEVEILGFPISAIPTVRVLGFR
jgi:hypothetical protein